MLRTSRVVFKDEGSKPLILCGLPVNRHHPLSTLSHSSRCGHEFLQSSDHRSARELSQGNPNKLLPSGTHLHAHLYSAPGPVHARGCEKPNLCALDHCLFLSRSVGPSDFYWLWRLMGLDCPARIVSFAMRAILAKSESAGENFDLVLSQQIIYGVGFFGILYSAY